MSRVADQPLASDEDCRSLQLAIELARAQIRPTGKWASVRIHRQHDELIAAGIWGRYATPQDDHFRTLPRWCGLPVEGAIATVLEPDQIIIVDDAGNQDLLLVSRWWLLGETGTEQQEYYHQLRATDVPAEIAAYLTRVMD